MTGDVTYGVFTPSIWSLVVLSDSTIISGDSNGQIQIWDGHVGVLSSSFSNHLADVLTIAVTPNEETIFASGIDGKVISLQRSKEILHIEGTTEGRNMDVSTELNNGNDAQLSGKEEFFGHWIYSHAQRIHTHDVLSLAVCNTAPASSVTGSATPTNHGFTSYKLISGGLDAKLCYYDCKAFHLQRPQFLPTVPTTGLVSPSRDYSYLAIQNRRRVDLWHVQYPTISSSNGNGSSKSTVGNHDEHCALALSLQLSEDDCKSSMIDRTILSASGRLLTLTTSMSTRFYLITPSPVPSSSSSSSSSAQQQKVFAKKVINAPLLLQGKDHHITAFTIHTRTVSTTTEHEESLGIFYKGSKQVFYIYRIRYPTATAAFTTTSEDNTKPEVTFELLHTIPYEPPKSTHKATTHLTKSLSYTVKEIVMSDDQKYFTVINANHAIMTHAIQDTTTVLVHSRLNEDNAMSIATVKYLTTTSSSNQNNNTPSVEAANTTMGGKKKGKKDKAPAAPTPAPTASASEETSSTILAVLGCNNIFYLYDLQKRSLHPWSSSVGGKELHAHGFPHTLPHHLVGMNITPTTTTTASADSTSLPYKCMLYNLMQCVYVNFSLPYPTNTRTPPVIQPWYLTNTSSTTATTPKLAQIEDGEKVRFQEEPAAVGTEKKSSKKRKQVEEESIPASAVTENGAQNSEENKNLTLINKYRNVIHVGFVNENNLVSLKLLVFIRINSMITCLGGSRESMG
jgi:hypothetical protein